MNGFGAAQDKLRQLARIAYVDWAQGQGAKIKANRPQAVADHCIMLAFDFAGKRQPLILTAAEIDLCEQRALSQARVAKFGPIPRTAEEWTAQLEQVREGWAREPDPRGDSEKNPKPETAKARAA
jgi:hypothetical protein